MSFLRQIKTVTEDTLVVISGTKLGLNIILAKPNKIPISYEEWLKTSNIRVIVKNVRPGDDEHSDVVIDITSLVEEILHGVDDILDKRSDPTQKPLR